jgi:hypothetical protein
MYQDWEKELNYLFCVAASTVSLFMYCLLYLYGG